jgi:hypothetical protein
MRKILLLLFAFASGIGFAQAQTVCTPNPLFASLGIPGVYPNPLQSSSIDPGQQGVAYQFVFTMIVPADTTLDLSSVVGFPIPPVTVSVNYQEVTGLTGLPQGLNYQCDISNCQWVGGQNGCLKLSGIPTESGTFTVGMTTGYNVNVPAGVPVIGGAPLTVPIPGISWDYEVTAVGIEDLRSDVFGITQNTPNPFHGSTKIIFNAPKPSSIEMVVFDLSGKQVAQMSQRATMGINKLEFDGSELAPGVYIYHLSNGEQMVSSKMVVQ